jgi:hypothetical protein
MKKIKNIVIILGILATSTLVSNAYVLESLESANYLAEK